MRPLRPACGTVLNAQLLMVPVTISASANGVVTTQLSFLPPASSSATDVWGSSESRPATAQPPEPPPTTTKSNVSVTRAPRIMSRRACRAAPALGRKTRLLRRLWQGRFPFQIWDAKPVIWASQKPQKRTLGPFQSRDTLIHTPGTQGPCPGRLLRKPPDGIDRRRT